MLNPIRLGNTPVILALVATLVTGPANAAETRKTFYVSKLGDNSDGHTWATAFSTIQKALLALPDASGGCRIVIRPDTYVEANLYPAFQGAPGAYNTLEGDFDGRLGSGTSGWVVIDSGNPAKGFKSYDWWSTDPRDQQGLVAGPYRSNLLRPRVGPVGVAAALCHGRRCRVVLGLHR